MKSREVKHVVWVGLASIGLTAAGAAAPGCGEDEPPPAAAKPAEPALVDASASKRGSKTRKPLEPATRQERQKARRAAEKSGLPPPE
jgi:hypothetical protein